MPEGFGTGPPSCPSSIQGASWVQLAHHRRYGLRVGDLRIDKKPRAKQIDVIAAVAVPCQNLGVLLQCLANVKVGKERTWPVEGSEIPPSRFLIRVIIDESRSSHRRG